MVCKANKILHYTYTGLSAQGISAMNGLDYQIKDGLVTFDGTMLMGTFLIDIINDTKIENTETFTIHLVNIGNDVVVGSGNTAVVTIGDDDGRNYDYILILC